MATADLSARDSELLNHPHTSTQIPVSGERGGEVVAEEGQAQPISALAAEHAPAAAQNNSSILERGTGPAAPGEAGLQEEPAREGCGANEAEVNITAGSGPAKQLVEGGQRAVTPAVEGSHLGGHPLHQSASSPGERVSHSRSVARMFW